MNTLEPLLKLVLALLEILFSKKSSTEKEAAERALMLKESNQELNAHRPVLGFFSRRGM